MVVVQQKLRLPDYPWPLLVVVPRLRACQLNFPLLLNTHRLTLNGNEYDCYLMSFYLCPRIDNLSNPISAPCMRCPDAICPYHEVYER